MFFNKILISIFLLQFFLTPQSSANEFKINANEHNVRELIRGWTKLIIEKTGITPQVSFSPDLTFQAGTKYTSSEISFYFTQGVMNKSDDEALLIACHEIGHILGKVYKNPRPGNLKLTATEGEADFFAGMCLRKYFERFPKEPLNYYNICNNSKTCNLILQSALEMFNSDPFNLNFSEETLKLNLPPSPTGKTLQIYPTNECRFHSIYAGFLQKPRPNCWFLQP